ncbi:hypothetical protein JUJ52_02640 [Virgibacillus sp. AGTR]|uniref:hypothetical protein n=1 Tax=Virgibacillus sp. AGTR TaxID=2812055 RepID=UPI001D15F8C9|nr:hypothetical protein [Virgibacillus sp. AGTR]MCC2248857.1 hypothetical protein [Virgibacillus sp. AGTR]
MSDLYELDSLETTYQTLIADTTLMDAVGGVEKVWKYHIPEDNREDAPLIRISPISELPGEYGDNKQLSWDCIVQIDVWDYADARSIALQINKLMKTINFKQSTPTFEFDPDTYLIRDGRRYRGVLYSNLKENE